MVDHTLQKQMIQGGAFLSGIAVAFGAFGAHLLKDAIDETAMEAFQTAVRYQFYHAFAIIMTGMMLRKIDPIYARMIFRLFFWGIVVFSGSLYIVSTRQFTLGERVRWIGGLAPIGGILFLSGWGVLAFKGYKNFNETEKSRHSRSSSSETRERTHH